MSNSTVRFPSFSAAASYFAAMIDGEGNVSSKWYPSIKSTNRAISIFSTEEDILQACVDAAAVLGIQYRLVSRTHVKQPNWADAHGLLIESKAQFRRVIETVPLLHEQKALKLRELLASYIVGPIRLEESNTLRYGAIDNLDTPWYLAGIIDAEGHISVTSKTIYITNTNYDLLALCGSMLEARGIEYRIHARSPRKNSKHAQTYDIQIYGLNNFKLALSSIPIQSQRKVDTLVALIEGYKYRTRWRPAKEELEDMYYRQEMTTTDIANYFGTHAGTVGHWFEEYGIKARSHSESARLDNQRRKKRRA